MGKDEKRKRGKIEVVRDVLVILTCLIIIGVVLVGGFLAMRYGPQIYRTVSTAYGVVNGFTEKLSSAESGLKEFISTGGTGSDAISTTDKSALCKDLLDAKSYLAEGDLAAANKKLDSAKTYATSKGLTNIVKLIQDTKAAANSGDALGILTARNALNKELGCE